MTADDWGGDGAVGMRHIRISEVVGGGYDEFWNFRGRYRVVKGSRASKKSKTAALWYIVNMMKYPTANTLVVRKTYRTLKESCFTELKWAVQRLGVADYWKCTESPLGMVYLPTGQRIYFRGLDDPLKVTSITVEVGSLCWLWIEEAYELADRREFEILDESIRGQVAAPLFKQVTLTFNPWNERHWLKARFFDCPPDPELLAMTTDYRCNEWLDAADLKLFETMKRQNPRRYQVAGLGSWGVTDGLVYENWRQAAFDPAALRGRADLQAVFGLDFGYINDPTALFCGLADPIARRLYVFDELYERGLSNEKLAARVQGMGYGKERIIADSAEPKSIDRLYDLGLRRIRPARKGPDSIINGIDFLREFEILIAPGCVNFLSEIASYVWDRDRFGHAVNRPAGEHDHLMDAMRYAVEGMAGSGVFSFD